MLDMVDGLFHMDVSMDIKEFLFLGITAFIWYFPHFNYNFRAHLRFAFEVKLPCNCHLSLVYDECFLSVRKCWTRRV